MSSEKLRERFEDIHDRMDTTLDSIEKEEKEVKRVTEIAKNTPEILKKLDKDFQEKTKLTKTDIGFLFVAVGLQIARQYLLTRLTKRLSDKEAADSTWGHAEEHSARFHRYYNPSLDEIITNPVPFDALNGANGALSGGRQLGHRGTTLGHDPILGLIFGTANIATATITTTDLSSYHIGTGLDGKDFFRNRASTVKIFESLTDKLVNGGTEGIKIVGCSLMKEIIHLRSDMYSKNSLAMPGLSIINPQTASQFAQYGLHMANFTDFGKQAAYSMLINILIAMIHRAFANIDEDNKLYEVRTRKILMYSNLISSTSNLAYCGITKDWEKLDVGGVMVTVWRVITDTSFISKVKQEFLFDKFKDIVESPNWTSLEV